MSSISEKSFGKPGEKDSWVFLQRMLERGPQSHPSKSDVQPRCCFVALAFLREFQGVQDRLLVDVFLMGWRSQQHWICSLGISLKKAEKMGFLAWREEPLLVRPCNYLKTLHVKLDAAAEQLSRALPVQKTLISLAWIVLQSRAKNNVIERAAQLFFLHIYNGFFKLWENATIIRVDIPEKRSNKLLFLKSIKLFWWETSLDWCDYKLPGNHG